MGSLSRAAAATTVTVGVTRAALRAMSNCPAAKRTSAASSISNEAARSWRIRRSGDSRMRSCGFCTSYRTQVLGKTYRSNKTDELTSLTDGRWRRVRLQTAASPTAPTIRAPLQPARCERAWACPARPCENPRGLLWLTGLQRAQRLPSCLLNADNLVGRQLPEPCLTDLIAVAAEGLRGRATDVGVTDPRRLENWVK